MLDHWWIALLGGALIGAASALLWIAQGRIAGISGVLGALVSPASGRLGWRLAFLGGLLGSGVVAAAIAPGAVGAAVRPLGVVVLAGLLVGFGTNLGSGCTSGHGVCGLSRLSRRSLVAVATFMATGALTAWIAGGMS
ncbi:MAG: YeeE/YedE family protein [Kofleriaceae bacterium]